jgi:hypothetical protein
MAGRLACSGEVPGIIGLPVRVRLSPGRKNRFLAGFTSTEVVYGVTGTEVTG